MVHHRFEAFFAFIGFGQVPGAGFHDVLIAGIDQLPDGRENFVVGEFVIERLHRRQRLRCFALQRFVFLVIAFLLSPAVAAAGFY